MVNDLAGDIAVAAWRQAAVKAMAVLRTPPGYFATH
jgi:hypothetical protein